jgi:Tol biopolymer transport system component
VFARSDGLFTVNTFGAPHVRRLNYSPVAGFPVALQPTWSPDGSRIAFSDATTPTDYPDSIVVMRADGSDVNVLQHGFDPFWSPNSASIAGHAWVNDGNAPTIYQLTMHADGTDLTTMPIDGATFSPNSAKIAYFNASDLYVSNVDSSNPVRILQTKLRDPLWRGGSAR